LVILEIPHLNKLEKKLLLNPNQWVGEGQNISRRNRKHCPKKDTTRKDTLCMTVIQQYLRRNASKEEQQNAV